MALEKMAHIFEKFHLQKTAPLNPKGAAPRHLVLARLAQSKSAMLLVCSRQKNIPAPPAHEKCFFSMHDRRSACRHSATLYSDVGNPEALAWYFHHRPEIATCEYPIGGYLNEGAELPHPGPIREEAHPN